MSMTCSESCTMKGNLSVWKILEHIIDQDFDNCKMIGVVLYIIGFLNLENIQCGTQSKFNKDLEIPKTIEDKKEKKTHHIENVQRFKVENVGHLIHS